MPRTETANSLDIDEFKQVFLSDSSTQLTFQHPQLSSTYSFTLESASSISLSAFNACYNLISSSSASDYSSSSIGWSPAKKRKEMRLPDLRYILVRPSIGAEVEAFLSFMLTYEDGYEVIYCYEIHLAPHLQRCGLGKRLMCLLEEVGSRAKVEKAMLTVFIANNSALAFYQRLDYQTDDCSPQARKLRNGVVKKPDYIILSKLLAPRMDS